MSDKINSPYFFLETESVIISKNFKSHKDWDKPVFNLIKENIINHLRIEQDNKCCYCKNELGFDIKNVDIEHIIPKSECESFTFHNKNLALSCPACNTKKGKKTVLKTKFLKYPKSGKPFIIVHAHYDDYSTHIINREDCIYVPLTAKGAETIKICELFRFNEVMKRAQKFQTKNSIISQLTEEIRTGDPSETSNLIELLKSIISK